METPISFEEMKAQHASRLEGLGRMAAIRATLADQQSHRPGALQKLLSAWRRIFAQGPVPALKKG